jgi:hypothetical protein
VTDTLSIDEEVSTDIVSPGGFERLLGRLNHQSVTPGKHFDAYVDVPWDDPEFAIDVTDPRWELGEDDPLGATEWYRSQPQEVRALIGVQGVATAMKVGLQFESILKRGLLEYAFGLPNGSPAFRYAYHEVIEESQHSLMFQEFVNRTGFDVPGMPALVRFGSRRVVGLGRRFPELFFVFVLGGEDPIDHVQRIALRRGGSHPLLERIMRIHVTEEARHLSFARHYLKERAPRLSLFKRARIAIAAPVILGVMAQLMMRPSPWLVHQHRIPRSVLREAYSRNRAHREEVRTSLRKVRNLLDGLGLIPAPARLLWRALGIWEPRASVGQAASQQ